MKDLPCTTQNGKYTQAELQIFNQYRQQYRESVQRLKACDIRDQLSERGENRIDSHRLFGTDGATRRIGYLIANNTAMRHLERLELSSGKYIVPKTCDLLTALYVPVSLEWIVLHVGNQVVGYLRGAPAPPLEEMLRQSRELPQVEQRPLDDLLALARRHRTGYVHRQEDVITLDGEEYVRWVFCEPYFPLVGMSCTVDYEVPMHTSIYVEGVFLDVAERNTMAQGNHVLFITGDTPGLAIAMEGIFDRQLAWTDPSVPQALLANLTVPKPPPVQVPQDTPKWVTRGDDVYTSLI